jgi:hypothetical protein
VIEYIYIYIYIFIYTFYNVSSRSFETLSSSQSQSWPAFTLPSVAATNQRDPGTGSSHSTNELFVFHNPLYPHVGGSSDGSAQYEAPGDSAGEQVFSSCIAVHPTL